VDLHTVSEVVDPRSPWREGDAWLGGGTWLFSEPQPHVTRLRDLGMARWEPLVEHPDGSVELAATCTVARLSRHPLALVGQCCRAFLASFKIWNVATVGGNLCAGLPAGPMISLTAALDGRCLLIDPNGAERTLSVPELILGAGHTALQPGELLRSITLSADALSKRHAMRRASLYPLARSAALVIGTRGADDAIQLTITASTHRPHVVAIDQDTDLTATIEEAVASEGWYDDVHGDPQWRRHMTLRFAEEIRQELMS
jgi:CO/xanthine dehydrogenase FAD-binding subunit